MGHTSCCVVGCTNTGRNSNCKFYRFPTAAWKLEKRKKWINAVKRKNFDGSPWYPKPSDHICSDHFVGGKKSEEELSPSYIPTIFPSIYGSSTVNTSTALNRHKRFMERRIKKQNLTTAVPSENDKFVSRNNEIIIDNLADRCYSTNVKKISQATQVNIFFEPIEMAKTFICNRYIYNDKNDAEVQTSITEHIESKWKIPTKNFSEKSCGTDHMIRVDKCVATGNKCFCGFKSIRKDDQLMELAGVTFNNFDFLLKKMSSMNKCLISNEDRLLIFLMKIKTGLTFSTLSALFDVHRTTISRIFHTTLQNLVSATTNLIYWPDSETLKATMPAFFRLNYGNTRVIIDCVEFKIEVPASIDNSVYRCPNNDKAFTAKILIGITPGGFLCFKSKAVGARITNSQLIVDSGLINNLKGGDVILTGKKCYGINAAIYQSEKQIKVVTPKISEDKTNCQRAEPEKPNSNVAKVQIHIKKMIESLKVYKVLDNIPENLFDHVDDIIHICCVLVNLNKEKVNIVIKHSQPIELL
ncbi:GSCOCG00007189001-RA-CDS [Cotesia congregata]|nr:GSCOCG00007189001-RA-CDS [Cotesia congregata]